MRKSQFRNAFANFSRTQSELFEVRTNENFYFLNWNISLHFYILSHRITFQLNYDSWLNGNGFWHRHCVFSTVLFTPPLNRTVTNQKSKHHMHRSDIYMFLISRFLISRAFSLVQYHQHRFRRFSSFAFIHFLSVFLNFLLMVKVLFAHFWVHLWLLSQLKR